MLGKPSAAEPFAKQRLIRYLEERGRLGPAREADVDEHTQRVARFSGYSDHSLGGESADPAAGVSPA